MSFIQQAGSSIAQAGDHVGDFFSQLGDVATANANIVAGKTSVPVFVQNNTRYEIGLRIRYQVQTPPEAFPDAYWVMSHDFSCPARGRTWVADCKSSIFYMYAYAVSVGRQHWQGPYKFAVNEGNGTVYYPGFFLVNMGQNWLSISDWTQNLHL
jgi:hypothetical protein